MTKLDGEENRGVLFRKGAVLFPYKEDQANRKAEALSEKVLKRLETQEEMAKHSMNWRLLT